MPGPCGVGFPSPLRFRFPGYRVVAEGGPAQSPWTASRKSTRVLAAVHSGRQTSSAGAEHTEQEYRAFAYSWCAVMSQSMNAPAPQSQQFNEPSKAL